MAKTKIDEVSKVEVTQVEPQYYLSKANTGICEKLPMSAKFAQKMMRGAQGNPNMFVTSDQQTMLKQYVPATNWSKDERTVYLLMQSIMDKTGTVPTVAQISNVSKGRATIANTDRKVRSQTSVVDEVPISNGLSTAKVQRALNKLQKRGLVVKSS